MGCIGKTIFRTALIGGLALGGATLLLGPQRVTAGFHTVQGKVQGIVDTHLCDDPIAIRRQLQKVAAELPEKIGEIRGELAEVDRQIAQMERDSQVAQGVVGMTTAEINDLQTALARIDAEQSSTSRSVAFHYDGRRFNVNGAKREMLRVAQIRDSYEGRLAANEKEIEYLAKQRERLSNFLADLETEEATLESQMYQIDRQIEAIARNEKLVERLEEREESLANYESKFDLSSLEAIQAKLNQWETEVEARLQSFDRKTEWRDYETEVKWQLQQQEREELLDFDTEDASFPNLDGVASRN